MLDEHLDLELGVHPELIDLGVRLKVIVDERVDRDRVVIHLLQRLVIDAVGLGLQFGDRVVIDLLAHYVFYDLLGDVGDEVKLPGRDEQPALHHGRDHEHEG